MKCLLCGLEFFPEDAQCEGCAANRGCKVIRCPHCGYQMVADSPVLAWIKKIWIISKRVGRIIRIKGVKGPRGRGIE